MAYLKERFSLILFIFLIAGIFMTVFSLYGLPLEAVGYAFLLSTVLGIFFAGWDWWRYFCRHKTLEDLRATIVFSLDKMPQPIGLLEKDYQQLITVLYQEKQILISQSDQGRQDMLDYYTLWVHQIKTPMATIGLLLQPEEGEVFEEISLALFKVEQYVKMALQYLRVDSRGADFLLQSYPLDQIIKKSVHKQIKLFVRKKIGLDYGPLSVWVLTDEKWLTFVIDQILSNALKYTNKGQISIYLEEGKTLVIEDSGIGIKGEDLPRIFEKGFTGYNGRLEQKSTGLGLYLCQQTLKKLSHTITVESQVGQGTKVKLGLASIDLMVE